MAKKDRDTYEFRREDNGKIIRVSFTQMMEQDVSGFIKLPGGVAAKRVHSTHKVRILGSDRRQNATHRTHVSDSLGIGAGQLEEMEADRKLHGFNSTSFKQDPDVKGFFQAHFDSPQEWRRYVKHRGLEDHNGITCANPLAPGDFERAQQRVRGQQKINPNTNPARNKS